VAKGVGPQPDECFADVDVELDRHHARGLVHHVVEIGAGFKLGSELAGGALAWIARSDWATMSAITKASACCSSESGPGRSESQVEGSQLDRAHFERETEYLPARLPSSLAP